MPKNYWQNNESEELFVLMAITVNLAVKQIDDDEFHEIDYIFQDY